jgi:four helix bundle protein
MPVIRGFRELDVYKRSVRAAKALFELSKRFPAEERYSLTDQVRRSSRAVGSMVAEAWARRRYQAVFVNKIDEALGEAAETQSWLDHALVCGYISRDEYEAHNDVWQGIGGMLERMVQRASTFCDPPRVR